MRLKEAVILLGFTLMIWWIVFSILYIMGVDKDYLFLWSFICFTAYFVTIVEDEGKCYDPS